MARNLPTSLAAWAILTALSVGLRELLGLAVPLGPDAAMWGLAASELGGVQPLYPAILALLSVFALPWWTGGIVSIAAFTGVGVLLVRLSQRLEVAPVAVAVLLVPDVLVQAVQLQPDALTQLLLLMVLAAALHLEDTGRAWPLVLLAALLAATREHGLVVLPAACLALLARRDRRWTIGAALLVLVLGAALVAGLGELLPERLAMPLRTTPFGAEPPPWAQTVGTDWSRGALRVWADLLFHLLREHGDHHLLIVLGAIGFYRAGRPTALIALAPLPLLLFFFAQDRHTAVLLPVAALGIVASRSRLIWLLGALVACFTIREAPRHIDAVRAEAQTQVRLQDLTMWMKEQSGSWALGGRDNGPNLYLRWPRHSVDLDYCAERFDAAAWRTMWIGPELPAPLQLAYEREGMQVWWLGPTACTDAMPTGRLYAAEAVSPEAGACSAPALFDCDSRSPIIKEETP
ncbi:MAG TPA: hypothetical protein QGF58_22570 [Myxococcota bacterium]|nr:hypothetical protein [Myxococcota bacterium]